MEHKPATPPPPRRSPARWIVGALAAAVVVVAAIASAALWFGGDDTDGSDSAGSPVASAPATSAAPSPSARQSARAGAAPVVLQVVPQRGRCLLPNPDQLRSNAKLAFQGTVARIDASSHTALLDVSRWIHADGFGGSNTVQVRLPRVGSESAPTFRVGHTYLVAANGDQEVMGCGFSGEKSHDLATLYGRAFV